MTIGSVRSCRKCSGEFKVKRVNQIYCSTACRRNRKQKLENRICGTCRRSFKPKRAWQMFCTQECRTEFRRQFMLSKTYAITCPHCGGKL